MVINSLMLLVTAVFCTSVATEEKFYYPDHEFDRTTLGDSIDRASMSFLKEAYESALDKNIVASPLGVFTLLSMYASGAGPQSREQIVNVLGAGNYSKLLGIYGELVSKLSSVDSRSFDMANKIYLAEHYTLQPLFDGLARSFGELEKISFVDPKAATAVINQWAEKKTRGNIKNPVSEGVITADTKIGLFDVIFFKDQWSVPFDSKNTQYKDFHVDKTTTVKKPMMNLLQPLFYHKSEEIGARMVELPYKQNGFRMVIVLPDELDGLPSVIEKIEKKGILDDVFNLEPSDADIDFSMPKFEIKSEHNLKQLLPKMGINKIFIESATGIVKEEGVVVSEAFQKAFVKVDEEGATAAAFTGLIAVPISFPVQTPEPIKFQVDHPSLFLILYKDIVLFAGTMTH